MAAKKKARRLPSTNGRDPKTNRFLPGNAGGPGNPFAAKVNALRKALLDATTPEEVQEIWEGVKKKAKACEPWAVQVFYDRTLGKALQAVEMDSDGAVVSQLADMRDMLNELLRRPEIRKVMAREVKR